MDALFVVQSDDQFYKSPTGGRFKGGTQVGEPKEIWLLSSPGETVDNELLGFCKHIVGGDQRFYFLSFDDEGILASIQSHTRPTNVADTRQLV